MIVESEEFSLMNSPFLNTFGDFFHCPGLVRLPEPLISVECEPHIGDLELKSHVITASRPVALLYITGHRINKLLKSPYGRDEQ
ncbi:hypothetical protein QE152_g31210 [Popillia japonica]|uniref:Uncharacterized protein n=1 Tax=Popillia japonica TaxID=7064 RepID=A0AAW1JC94_POPJA